LRDIEQRVLWLAASIVHAANVRRPNDSGVKVGGHQPSSASLVSVMTALWFDGLTAADRVSVKPHASRPNSSRHDLRSWSAQFDAYTLAAL
jgi:pyruvate dehydrogenase E1 component